MSSSLVIVLGKVGNHYCVIDVVPHSNSSGLSWNENERYQAINGSPTLVYSKWYRDKEDLKHWNRLDKSQFEYKYGKVKYP